MARIAFVLPDMGGGGAERVALTLIEAFLARGHDIDLVLLRADGALLPLVPKQVRLFDLKTSGLVGGLLPLWRYFRAHRPDAVQVSMWPLTIVAILAHRLARSRARLVVSDHTTLSIHYGIGRLLPLLLRATTRLFYPLADARVIVSGRAADDLARLSGLRRSSIDVIYNPIADRPAEAGRDVEVERLWGAVENARILSVGALKEVKNFGLLIRAFARVAERRPARLIIVGEGPLRAQLAGVAEAEGVADRVQFVGFVDNPWPYYASAHLFVLSSDYEGFGNVLVEAMAMGLPVVSTDCESGPSEILDDGRYGRLVACGDVDGLAQAIGEMLDGDHDREALRRRAETLSGAGSIDRYLELLAGPTDGKAARS